MVDIVIENTHATNLGRRDRFFALEIIDLKRFCFMKFSKIWYAVAFYVDRLLIYKILPIKTSKNLTPR